MKVVGIIPARYESSRFPGKPLADICGKPMIWWVYNAVKNSKISDLYVATDDIRISNACNNFNIPNIMTKKHKYAIDRVQEITDIIKADYYVQINGDEPLIDYNVINKILINDIKHDQEYIFNIVTKIKNPVELLCPTNIKIIFNNDKEVLYLSRSPIPNPYNNIEFTYYKHVGILGYNKKALDFFKNTAPGYLENIEGIELIRFIEHKKKFISIIVDNIATLSVDTPKDIHLIRNIIQTKYKNIYKV